MSRPYKQRRSLIRAVNAAVLCRSPSPYFEKLDGHNSLRSSISGAELTPRTTSVTTRGMSDASEPKALLPYGAQKYEKRYSEEQFWGKVQRFAKVAGKRVVETALQLYFSAQSPQTPARARSVIYGALAYFILPIDIIPDLLPGVGYTDDLTVLLAAIGIVATHITPEIKHQARNKAAEWFGEQPTP